jgi:predicted chitinase
VGILGDNGQVVMFDFDNAKFIDGYKQRFGPVTPDLASAIEFLLAKIEADTRFTENPVDRWKIAYCLATFKWETAHTLRPIDEHGGDAYFNKRYAPGTTAGTNVGNTQPGDGARYHGRGFVQLTGRFNYDRAGKFFKVDLIGNPDRAKEPELAYEIAMEGMTKGWFTGAKLAKFFKTGAPPNYEDARTIINGHDKAQTIADLARRFDELLANALA